LNYGVAVFIDLLFACWSKHSMKKAQVKRDKQATKKKKEKNLAFFYGAGVDISYWPSRSGCNTAYFTLILSRVRTAF
jgi:deoxyinosine 3'endonuclease (endonuclease V)